MRRQKLISYLENLLLLNFSIFLILMPYLNNLFLKCCLYSGIFWWLLINILRYKQRFYQGFVPVNPLNRYFLFFSIACLFSIIFSFNPYHSQSIFFERFLYFALFFWIGVGLVSSSKRNLYFLISAFILSGFIFGLGGIRDYIFYSRINPALAIRLWSVFGKRIEYYGFPLYLTFFIPFNFTIFIVARNKFLRIVGLVNSILLYFCLLSNGSRIGLFSVLISFLFITFLKKKKIILVSLIILISIILSLSITHSSPELKLRVKTMFKPNEWSFRLPLYHSAISMFRDYPLTGVGIGMFEKALHIPKYELPKDYPVPKELNLHAHNTYLEIMAEMGIIGILTFLLIFIIFFIKSIRLIIVPKGFASENEQAIFLGLVGTILTILVFAFGTTIITVGLTVSGYFWFLLGMAVGFYRRVYEGNNLSRR